MLEAELDEEGGVKIEIGVPFHEANQNHVIQNSLWGIGSPRMFAWETIRFASKVIHTPSVILVKLESSRGAAARPPFCNAVLNAVSAGHRRVPHLWADELTSLLDRRRRASWPAPPCAIC